MTHRVAVALWIAIATACSEDTAQDERDAGAGDREAAQEETTSGPEEAAPRSEAGDDASLGPDVRALLTDVVAHDLCGQLEGGTTPLGGGEGAPATGRLWMRKCDARREGQHLVLSLDASAWRWVDRVASQAGASFAVNQYVVVAAHVEIEGVLRVAYDRERHVATVWLRPSRPPQVRARSVGRLAVEPEGLWSDIVGGAASLFGSSPTERAEERVGESAAADFREQLSEGISVAIDLCTAQRYLELGRLREGEIPESAVDVGGDTYETAELIQLRPRGLGASGPFRGVDGRVEVEVSARRGGPVRAQLVCEEDGQRVLRAYVERGLGAVPEVPSLDEAVVSSGTRVLADGAQCTTMVLVRMPRGADGPATYGVVARARRARAEPLVQGCDGTSGDLARRG